MHYYRTAAFMILVSLLLTGCRPLASTRQPDEPRIVSLAPSLTESLCAIGAGHLIVGRTSACDYPPETVVKIPVIGDFGRPSLELIAQAEPTMVLDTALADETMGTKISAMGIERRRISCETLADIAPMLRELGQITGHTNQADALAGTLTEAISEARATVRSEITNLRSRPSVYAEVWHDPLITIGNNTFLADLIRLAGGTPIAESVRKDYFHISPEQIISENPDIILCLYMSSRNGSAAAVKRRSGWEHVNAVTTDCVFENLNNDVLLRAGPRLLQGLDTLRECIRQTQERQRHAL